MDFGLAKSQRVRDDGSTDGSVVGTPAYMSPEQARGDVQHTGPLSDQYSLGTVLYQSLTGQRPYSGSTLSVITRVADEHHSPPSPSSLDPAISKDLEACCLRAMHNDPAQRYASSLDFAADLRRWLRGEPVHARPISTAERLWRWCKRNRTIASLTAAIALLLLAGSITATTAAFRFSNLADRERVAKQNAEIAKYKAVLAAENEKIAADKAELAAHQAEIALSDSYTNSGLVANDSGNPAQAVLWFANAAAQARKDRQREIASRIRIRNWSRELPLPVAVLPEGEKIKHLAFHPSGRYLLTMAVDGKCSIWDVEAERPVELPHDLQSSHAVVWNADGEWLAFAQHDRIVLTSFPHVTQRQEIAHAGSNLVLEFSRDGQKLAIGGESVRVWDVQQQQFVAPPLIHPQPVVKLQFNARGDRLVTAARDNQVRVFAVGGEPNATPLFEPLPNLPRFGNPTDPLQPLLIDDDRGLLTKTHEREVTWWNAETGERVRSVPVKHAVLSIARSLDGRRFIVCDFQRAHLWDVAAGVAVGPPLSHANYVYDAAFSGDGKTAITVSTDRKVGLWQAATGKPLGPMLAHQSEVQFVAAAAQGDHFATAQTDGFVRIWQLAARDSSSVLHIPIDTSDSPLGNHDRLVTLTTDGRSMTPSGWNMGRSLRSVRFYDVASGTPDQRQVELPGMVNHVAVSPDGQRFVTLRSLPANNDKRIETALFTTEPGVIEFWSRTTSAPLFPAIETPTEPVGAAWSSDDQTVAVICGGGEIFVIEARSGKIRHQCDQEAKMAPKFLVRDWIRFAPDGQTFATWGMGENVRVWDARTGARNYELKHAERCHDVKFSPAGDLVATMSMDTTVGIWNARTGDALAKIQHPDWVYQGEFSRDGRRILTACRDRMARLWDWQQGQMICPAMEHADEVFCVAFADRERLVLTGNRNGRVQWWDSHIAKPVGRPVIKEGSVYQVSVTPDEKHAVIAGQSKSLTVIRLQDWSEPVGEQIDVADLRRCGELLSGQHVHEGGGVVNLTTQQWRDCWNSFHERHPRYGQLFR